MSGDAIERASQAATQALAAWEAGQPSKALKLFAQADAVAWPMTELRIEGVSTFGATTRSP